MSLIDKFNLLNEMNLLRFICAVFFIPHIIGKFTVPQALQFYIEVGFKPPKFWMYLAGAIETVLTVAHCWIFTPRSSPSSLSSICWSPALPSTNGRKAGSG